MCTCTGLHSHIMCTIMLVSVGTASKLMRCTTKQGCKQRLAANSTSCCGERQLTFGRGNLMGILGLVCLLWLIQCCCLWCCLHCAYGVLRSCAVDFMLECWQSCHSWMCSVPVWQSLRGWASEPNRQCASSTQIWRGYLAAAAPVLCEAQPTALAANALLCGLARRKECNSSSVQTICLLPQASVAFGCLDDQSEAGCIADGCVLVTAT